MSSRRLLLVAFGLGLMVRLSFIGTTLGTSDVVYKMVWARLAVQHGTAWAYTRSPYLNEPPLAIEASAWLYRIAERTGLAFGDLYRITQVFADIGSALCLLLIGLRLNSTFPALLWLFSPPAILISGFQCNSDPAMVLLMLLSACLLMLEKPQPLVGGLILGLASGIKIVPLLLVPFYCLALGRRAWRFLAGLLAALGLIFGPAVATAGPAVLGNVFRYKGVGNWWGIVSILTALRRATEGADALLGRAIAAFVASSLFIILAMVLVLALLFWRAVRQDRQSDSTLLAVLGVALSAVLFIAPGFGVQYLLWPLPFLPFALGRRHTLIIHGLVTMFLAVVYTHWSGGLPWWYANSDAPGATTDAMVFLGWVVWLAMGYSAVVGARRMWSQWTNLRRLRM